MTALRRAVLLSTLLILWMTSQALGQQAQPVSLTQLQAQFRTLEAIDSDPNTSPEVRTRNRTFLEMRRTELQGAIIQRVKDLRGYLSSAGAALKPEERKSVELSISELEKELKDLTSAGSNESSGALKVDSIPLASALQDPCPKEIITSVFIRRSQNPPLDTLEIELAVPVARPPASDAAKLTNIMFMIPAGHIEEISVVDEAGNSTKLTPVPFRVGDPSLRRIRIDVTGQLPDGAKKVTVKLKDLLFACAGSPNPVAVKSATATGDVQPNAAILEQDIKDLNEEIKAAAAKRSDQKNFRMGFMAAKGDGEKAEGAADISFNKTFYGGGEKSGTVLDFFDQADVALQVKKSSAEKTDARQMVLGLNLLKTFLIGSRVSLADLNGSGKGGGPRTSSDVLKEKKGSGFFRVLTITEGLNLEGEAFDFKTSNFVSDTNFEIASIPKRLASGFFSLNIFGGPELGRNLSKPDAATTVGATADQLSRVDWITRLKAGGEFTLRLLPAATGNNWGLEFNAAFVNRTLFNSEVFTEMTTDAGENKIKTVTIGKGNKAYRQANLKVFLFGNDKARYGVNLTYMNGRLPPAFAPTKGFQFGLLVESSDDKKSGEPANK